MGYHVGIDLGTTYTAAAVHRDGRVEIVTLGDRAAAIPSVVLLREDSTILTGEAAARRTLTEPGRVAREFKRRVGDSTPVLLAGSPFSAEQLMANLLRAVLEQTAAEQGGPADRVAITHPANWGPYKIDLLTQAVRLADLPSADLLTEPQAAAIYYASSQRVEPGETVAVYDLGGGTFDAAVLRRTDGGFEIIGEPEGIERLGGIDFDEAVFAHVRAALGDAFAQLDPADPVALTAVARLPRGLRRREGGIVERHRRRDPRAAPDGADRDPPAPRRVRGHDPPGTHRDDRQPAPRVAVGRGRSVRRHRGAARRRQLAHPTRGAARHERARAAGGRRRAPRSTRSRSVPRWPVRPRPDTRKERPR